MAIKKFNSVGGFSVGEPGNVIDVVDNVANVYANRLFAEQYANLGSIANIYIGGGSAGYVLKTDGTGNLSWGIDTAAAAGNTTEVQFNTGGSLDSSSAFIFNKVSNALSITGNISTTNANLGNLATANYFSGTLTTQSQPNITSVGTLSNVTVTGNITSGNAILGNIATANYFSGNGSLLTSLTGENVTGQVSNALIAGTVYSNVQSNITSVGTLSSLSVSGLTTATGGVKTSNIQDSTGTNTISVSSTTVGIIGDLAVGTGGTGNVTANYFIGNGSLLTSITGANITGYVALSTSANTAATVTTNAQPNITSVGTLSDLSISGTGSISGANLVSANFLTGTLTTQSQPNITSVGTLTSLSISGNLTSGNARLGNLATANFFSGNGSLLTSITGSSVTGQVGNALVAGTVYSNAQPNITSVGQLASLTVTGLVTATAGGIKVGNLQDPTGTNTIQLTNSDIIVTGDITAGASGTGNVTATYFIGNGAQLTDIVAGNVTGQVGNALVAGTVYSNAQPNITSVGTLTTVSVSGNVTSGNATLGNLVTANYFSGDGSFLTNVPSGSKIANGTSNVNVPSLNGNVTVSINGTQNVVVVSSALATVNANLSVTGTITKDSKNVPSYVSSTSVPSNPTIGDQWYNQTTDITYQYIYDGATYYWVDISSGYIDSNVNAVANTLVLRDNNANIYGNYLIGSGLTVTGTANLGSVSNVKITGGTNGYILQTDGTGNLSFVSAGSTGIAGANTQIQFNDNGAFGADANFTYNKTTDTLGVKFVQVESTGNITGGNLVSANFLTGTLTTQAQPNITSVGNLSDLVVSGNATIAGNLTVSGNTTFTNANNLYIKDPIIEMGGGANGAPLTTNDGKDRGTLLHYYTTTPVDAFMGWDNSNGEFALGSNVTIASEVVTFNTFGNLRAAFFIGNGSSLTSITGGNVTGQVGNSLVAGTVYTNAQPNITSVGTLASLNVTGNVSSGSYLLGNGAFLTGLAAAYSNANVAAYLPTYAGNFTAGNANIAGTLFANTIAGSASSNVTITVGTYVSTFDELGNITLSNNVTVAANLTVNQRVNFTNTSNVTLGAVGNLHITGGTSGYILSTNGSGDLTWVSPSSTGIAGANTQVQFNDSGAFGASAGFTFDKTTNTLAITGNLSSGNANLGNLATANYFSGNGSLLTSLTAGNIVGQVGNALVAGTVYSNAQPNITSVGTLVSVNVTGNVSSGGNIIGSGQYLTSITGGNVTGQVGNALVAGTVYSNAQPNITSVGILSSLSVTANASAGNILTDNLLYANGVAWSFGSTYSNANVASYLPTYTGNVGAAYFIGNGSALSSLTGGNVVGQVGNALVAGTVYSNAQPNITSVGTLTSVDVSGNVSSGGNIIGNGQYLTSITGGNVTGQVGNALVAGTVYSNAQPNITSVGTLSSLSVTANVGAGNILTNNLLYANGVAWSFGSTYSNANVASYLPTYTGNISANTIIATGNVSGIYLQSTNSSGDEGGEILLAKPQTNSTIAGTGVTIDVYQNKLRIFEQGGTARGGFFDITALAAGVGTDFLTGGSGGYANSNVAAFLPVYTGNVNAAYFIGNGSTLTSITGGNVTGQVGNALVAGTVYSNAQPNITSVGTLTSVSVSGNVSSGGNIIGNGQYLTSITGGNVTGQVGNALVAGTVYSNAQPNITSVGILTSVDVSGNVSSGGNIIGNGQYLTAITGGNVTGQVGNALVAGTVYSNAQPNITSVGTLSSLSVTANITSGNATLGNLVTASFFSGNGSLLTSLTGANVTGTVANATYADTAGSATTAATVTTNAQPNITSLGSLTGLTVSNATGIVNFTNTANVALGAIANVHITGGTSGYVLQTDGTGGLSWVAQAGSGFNISGITQANPGVVTVTSAYSFLNGDPIVLYAVGGMTQVNNQPYYAKTTGYTSTTFALYSDAALTTPVDTTSFSAFTSGGQVSGRATVAVAGSNTQIQFNDSGVFGATTALTFNKVTNTLTTTNANLTTANVTGTITAGNITGGNLVSANYFSGSGNLLSNIQAGNITGTVANANYSLYAGTVITNAQPNITSVGTLISLSISGNLTSGNASLGNIASANIMNLGTAVRPANVQANCALFVVSNTVSTSPPISIQNRFATGYSSIDVFNSSNVFMGAMGAANPSATSVPALGNAMYMYSESAGGIGLFANIANVSFSANGNANILVVTGTGANVSGTLNATGNITGANANLGNLVTANYFTGTLTTNAQPNITSVGTLISVSVSGNVSSGGNIIGNGQYLTSITGGNVTGQVGNALVAGTVYSNAQPNITSVGILTSVSVTGNVSSGGNIIGNGQYLTAITGGNVTGQVGNALVAGTVYSNAQPNITSVGTLTSLVVSTTANVGTLNATDATVSGNVIVTGNLTVGGTTEYINVTNLYVKDPIIEMGGGPNGAALSTNDGKDRGTLLHYYTTAPVDAFMGWDNSNGEFGFGSNVSVSGEVVTWNNYGNIRAGYFIGNGSQLTSITGGNITGQVGNALVAGTVYTNAQPNITSVGTLASLDVTANITAGNIAGGNLVSANYISGNGSLLTSLAGANITGTVANANYAAYAGNVVTAAQPNITSLGSLSGLTVSNATGVVDFTTTANVTLGSVSNLHIAGGSANYVLSTNGSGSLSWVAQTGGGGTPGGTDTQVQFNDGGTTFGGNAGFTYNKTNTTLTANNFIATSTANLGAPANITITGGSADYVLKTDGAGNLSWTAQTGGGGDPIAITADAFTGNGVQTEFTLSVTPSNINHTTVNYNGATLLRDAYTLTGANIIFDNAPADGSYIEVTTTELQDSSNFATTGKAIAMAMVFGF